MSPVKGGMNTREVLREAKRLGCLIKEVRGTDELKITHPRIQRCAIFRNTRKDASRTLVVFVKRVAALPPE